MRKVFINAKDELRSFRHRHSKLVTHKTKCFNVKELHKTLIEKATPTEKFLCEFLRKNHVNFVFQKKFYTGKTHRFFDFWFPDIRVALELDGAVHENSLAQANDFYRSMEIYDSGRFFNSKIVRVKNEVVLDPEFTMEKLCEIMKHGSQRLLKHRQAKSNS